MGYLPMDFPSVETLAEEADRKLFKTISQFPSHVLRHLGPYLPTSPLLRDPSVLGPITSYCPLKTIGIFFLGHYIMSSALLWVTPRGR